MLAGEYMVASPNATISGNNITASWQTLINTVVPDGSPSGVSVQSSVNGFDFTFNAATNVTTWKNWNGARTNVVASGTVREPTSWLLNPTGTALQLANSNGSIYATINVNFLTKTFSAPDGNNYELQ
jgi:cellulase/cellobiase CelA1